MLVVSISVVLGATVGWHQGYAKATSDWKERAAAEVRKAFQDGMKDLRQRQGGAK